MTVYSEAVFAASDARAAVVDVAAVIPIEKRFDNTVKKPEIFEVDALDFLLLFELAFGIARADTCELGRAESDAPTIGSNSLKPRRLRCTQSSAAGHLLRTKLA